VNDDATRPVHAAVAAVLGGSDRIILAVSGGIDSMTLLDAACARLPGERVTVASFDHGTGPAAAAAVDLVRDEAADRGVEFVAGRASTRLTGEAALREARWGFLRAVARERRGTIWTGHTEDDQIETVLMRLMRGAGARGLAGLYAESDVVRPLVTVRRECVETYARRRGLRWIEDPSNAAVGYLRNRVRHELLPSLRGVDPAVDGYLLETARRAADWRRDVGALVDLSAEVRVIDDGRGLSVPVDCFGEPVAESARLVWPHLASRIGAVLDRRGIERLAQFTVNSRVGARVQLSGGWEVVRARNSFGLRRVSSREAAAQSSPLSDGMRFGAWSFRAEGSAGVAVPHDHWSAWLPTRHPLTVRQWRPGDAMRVGRGGSRRKVKHLLSAAGVTGHERAGWPVVVSGDEIVWIPGVRRIELAAARSGRPGLAYMCEYHNR
jgi:tRNA(Ile)-lysidine synthase